MMALRALSIMASEYGSLALISTSGCAARVLSIFKRMVIGTTTLLLGGAPAGGFQQFLRCRRNASISLSDNWFELASGAPIPTLLLTTSPVAATRCGVRLSSNAWIWRGSSFG